MFTYTTRSVQSLYVVKTSQSIQRHHGLRTNTSPHLLTFSPGPGDEIVAVARLHVRLNWEQITREDGLRDDRIVSRSARLELDGEETPVYNRETKTWGTEKKVLTISGHPGRACSLGEDTYEADTGEQIEDLVREHLESDFGGWRYAPVSAEFLDYYTPTDGTVISVKFERPFDGEWKVTKRNVARNDDYVWENAK